MKQRKRHIRKWFGFVIFQLAVLLTSSCLQSIKAQTEGYKKHEYTITISEQEQSITGKKVKVMTIDGGIPGPTLVFKEGEYAVIHVKNEMSVETSIHWHGLLLPNFQDGVPYLNSPPIEAGTTYTFEFPLIHSGTYWYHSHTMLQEQKGVYGSIIIEPKERTLEYDKEMVVMLSDWTNQKPINVLRNLKRGNEWYNVKKRTATPLNQVIGRGGFGAQMNFWRQRMESADIADIYYDAFLINGKEVVEYPEFKPGEKVRLRIINGSASSQFWLTFGGKAPLLVSSDGIDVKPVARNKNFIAIAETYDFIITIPEDGKIELRAMAQDGSGHATAYFGNGEAQKAEVLERPDKIGMMMKMAKMKMRMGAPAMKASPKKIDSEKMKNNWGMKMDMPKSKEMDEGMGMHKKGEMTAKMDMYSEYSYKHLQAKESTAFSEEKEIKEVLLNLTGNMNRYVWSLNGVPLSEKDKIKINRGEITRIKLNNLTMMHHPMHLHGHFFRVLNGNGDYSPLKHTVNVPPMQEVIIEFDSNEKGDWFFHCHVLYHMMGGMARVMSYGDERNPRMEPYPLKKIIKETNHFYSWGILDAASHMTGLNLVSSNIRNQFNVSVEFGYNKNIEAEATYQYYLYDYFSLFGGVNLENTTQESLDSLSLTAVAGIRWLSPYLFNVDMRIDHQLRPRIGVGRSLMIFPKTSVFGYYEQQFDFGWVNQLDDGVNLEQEIVWNAGIEYLLSRNFSITASYDNRFGAGGGLSYRF